MFLEILYLNSDFVLYKTNFTPLSNISTVQKRTGGVLTMFTDTIPVKVEVHYAKTVDGVRY